jgi:signal transduction histidine kinase
MASIIGRDIEIGKSFKDEVLELLPDAVIWARPVFKDRNSIVDFEICFSNKKADEIISHAAGSLVSLRILRDAIPSQEGCKRNFEIFLNVYQTGKAEEFVFYAPGSKMTIETLRRKFKDGVLSTIRDPQTQHETERKQQQTAAFLSNVLDASFNGIYSVKAEYDEHGDIVDFIFITVNKVYLKIVGRPASEVIGKRMLDLFPQNKGNGFFDKFCHVLSTGEPMSEEVFFEPKHKNFYWFEYAIVRLDDSTLVVTFQDITFQKSSMLEIERQRNILDNILKYTSSGISVTEVIRDEVGKVIDGKTIIANEAAERYNKVPNKEYLSKRISEVDPNILKSSLFKKGIEILETGVPHVEDYYFEPSKRWLKVSLSKMDDNHLVNIFTDVTETKELQQRLVDSVEELKHSNAQLEEFAHAASHDLKEPIRKVQIFLGMLKNRLSSRMDVDESAIFDRLETSAKRMTALVDDLLAYSEVSMISPEEQLVDLKENVENVLEVLEVAIEEKKAEISVGELPIIKGNKRQLQQLFQNLIGNALKYSKSDVPPKICISSALFSEEDVNKVISLDQKHKTYYHLIVSDNGIGFEQKNADMIFQIFKRLHNSVEYKGSGIGLSIARRVVENHQGHIWATSEYGQGSRFNILLPV